MKSLYMLKIEFRFREKRGKNHLQSCNLLSEFKSGELNKSDCMYDFSHQ